MRIIPAGEGVPPHAHPRPIARSSAGEMLLYEAGDVVCVTAAVSMDRVDAERAIMYVFDVCTGGTDVLHREAGSYEAVLHRDRDGRFSSRAPFRAERVTRVYVALDAVTVRCVDGTEMQVAAWGADVLPDDADVDAAVREAAAVCRRYRPTDARHTRYVGPFDGVDAQVRAKRPYGEHG